MPPSMTDLEIKAGYTLFDYQKHYLEAAIEMEQPARVCLYYRTGAGKSFTALASISLWGYDHCTVIAPPSTHMQWKILGHRLGIDITTMSHAMFRQRHIKLSRTEPVIADEFHMFGGHGGQGWKKLDRIALHLEAPLLLLSATPNYNDAERVYCVQHILDPIGTKGGYIQFLYTHCNTEQNRFSITPDVTGFKNYADAAEFLAALPHVYYLADELVVDINDISYSTSLPAELYEYGYDRRKHKLIASNMEMWHSEKVYGLVDEDGYIHPNVMKEVQAILARPGGVLIYANHATVANALSLTLSRMNIRHALMTGLNARLKKEEVLQEILSGKVRILIGTNTLATGTDGLDKVCDTLLILDDTDDNAQRRQLIGRIMPRGSYVSPVDKKIFRLKPVASRP